MREDGEDGPEGTSSRLAHAHCGIAHGWRSLDNQSIPQYL